MLIINNGNIFTDEQLKGVVKLLGRDYTPERIVIYETRLDMISHFFRCGNFSWEEFSGNLEGTYDQESDTAYICVFAQTDDGDDLHSKQLYSMHALVHELRHRYQLVNNYLTGDADEERAEDDADRFATNFLNNNSRRIKEIMNWDREWEIQEED